MRKLLILMLVLGLSSAANAVTVGYSMWVAYDVEPYPSAQEPPQENYFEPTSSEIWLYPSDTLWIGVYNSILGVPGATQQAVLYLAFLDSEDGEWTGNYSYYPGVIPDLSPGNEYLGNTYYGIYEGMDVWEVGVTWQDPTTTVIGIGVADAKQFHCTGPESDVTMLLLDSDAATVLDTFIIHQVPEPMTLMLLGLGGLLLRRRK